MTTFDQFFKGIGAQEKCFAFGDAIEHQCFIVYQQKLGGNWSNTYGSFKDIQDFLTFQKSIPPEERRFFELIRGYCPEYYDFDFLMEDWEGDSKRQKIDNVIDTFLKERNEFSFTNNITRLSYKKSDLVVLESCGVNAKGVDKLSLHIIVRPEMNNEFAKRYFRNCKEQKDFATLFSTFLEAKDSKIIIDKSVYNSNSLMRLSGSHKGDEVHRKFNVYTKNLDNEHYLFCSYVGEIRGDPVAIPKKEPKLTSVEFTFGESELTDNEYTILFDHIDVKRWDTYEECLSLIWLAKHLKFSDADIHSYCSQSSKYDSDWVQKVINTRKEECKFTIGTVLHFLKQDLSEDVYSKIVPKSGENTYQKIKKKHSTRRTQAEKDYLENVKNLIIQKQINSLFDYRENKFIKIKTVGESIPYVEDIVFPDGYRCVGIHAGLGLGKTSTLIRTVANMPKNAKVLVLSPRITFAQNISAEYNRQLDEDRQFHCYVNYKKKGQKVTDICFQNKIVMSMESLHYLNNFTPDLLILDECNANLISACCKETNGEHLDNNIYEFGRLLRDSKRVVVADAFLGSKVCNFFTDLEIPLFVYKYLVKPKKLTANFLTGLDNEVLKEMRKQLNVSEYTTEKFKKSSWWNKIIKILESGKKVFAFISSRKQLELLANGIGNSEFKGEFYSGVSQNEIPDDLNAEWGKKDIIATTSTITVGISHTAEYFDTKVIHYQASSNNYISDAIQAHFRVRKIKDSEIWVEVEEQSFCSNNPVDMKVFNESLDHKSCWYKSIYAGYSSLPLYMRNLVSHNYLEHSLSKQNPTKMMRRYLEECNYTICMFEETEKKEKIETSIKPDNEEFSKDIVKELFHNFPNVPRMAELEKEKLKRKLSASEREEIDKYWFWNIYAGGVSIKETFSDKNISTIALAYQIWKYQFGGADIIRSMRLEKKVLEGKMTIEQFANEKWDKTQYAELQGKEILKIQRIIYVCKKLGLKHCNDTETEIPQEKMDEFYEEAKHEYNNIQKDFGIQDKRVKKGDVTPTHFAGLCKTVFTASTHSMCNLEVVNEKQVRKNGKQVRVRSYGLVPNGDIGMQCLLFNEKVSSEHRAETVGMRSAHKSIPVNIFNTLSTSGQEKLCLEK